MDQVYWNNYYNKGVAPTNPSAFATDILSHLESGKKLVELGCGNGRDALLFAEKGIEVTAIDQSAESIKKLKEKHYSCKINFEADDFVESKILKAKEFNYVYSRFTIHSISDEEESRLVERVHETLENDGLFFIEVRSVKDEIYGLGEQVARNTYVYNEHTRRFIEKDELVGKLKNAGFKIVQAIEDKNFAIYKNENPIVIRIIAKK